MNLKKLRYYKKIYLDRPVQNLKVFLNRSGWDTTTILVVTACIIVIFAVSYNIYFAVANASQDYQALENRREELADAKERNRELNAELEYYSSLEYKQRYGHESLNLVRPGEEIYLIEKSDRADFELEKKNPDPILKDEQEVWWGFVWERIL
jgi:cell division protein FtsB